MSKDRLDWIPWEIMKWYTGTRLMSKAAKGIYMDLLMWMYMGHDLPDDDAQIAKIAEINPRTWKKYKTEVRAKFASNSRAIAAEFNANGTPLLVHDKVDKIIEDCWNNYKKRAEAGRKGGQRSRSNA